MCVKNFIENAFIALLAVLAPAQSMILTTLALVVIDLTTGLIAAFKQKQKITSSGIRRTATKLFVYQTAIILAFLTQTYLTGDSVPVCSLVAGFIGLTEFVSVLENLNKISDNQLLKVLLSKVKDLKKKKDQE